MRRDRVRILIIDDDEGMTAAVGGALRDEGYVVRAETDGRFLEDLVILFRPDLAILDRCLGVGADGPALARRLRRTSALPLIFLTAAGSERARVAAFEAGADDYLTKPFSMAELLLRIKAILRRSGRLSSLICEVGDVMIDEATRTVRRCGEALDLTRIEFELLSTFARHPGQVLTKSQLLTTVWGVDGGGDSNLVEVHTSALRRKLEAHGPRLVHTVRGTGYVLRPPP